MIGQRGLDPVFLAEIVKPVWYSVILVDLDWPDGRVRMHTGTGSLSWAGAVWAGAGDFASVSVPGEGAGLVTAEAQISIVGALDDILTASDAVVKNRFGAIYIGAVSERAGTILVGEPCEIFSGYMDGTTVAIQSSGAQMTHRLDLSLGSGPSARKAASISHSHEDQGAAYPGDTGGRHVQFAVPTVAKTTWPA